MNIATPNDTAMSESCGRFSPIEEILDELRAGRMIVLVDDEHRENEGDLRTLIRVSRSLAQSTISGNDDNDKMPFARARAEHSARTRHFGICKNRLGREIGKSQFR